ncbi:MAG: enoyl-CoA hydratase-related protein, partial [Burkholderiaceae bacterium]
MSEPAFETIVYERPEAGIARIVMNRPAVRNAQNLQMTYELTAAMDLAVADDEVQVLILAGADPHFSAGHDLRAQGQPQLGRDLPVLSTWGGFGLPGAEGGFAREQEIYL